MKNLIPKHKEGKKIDCFETVEFQNTAEAENFYTIVRHRLLNVNGWDEVAVLPSATFRLRDSSNKELRRLAQEKDFVRIDIPGPGLPSSDGFDWVHIECITEERDEHTQCTVLTLRPASDPTNSNPDIAHFFKNMATSSFLVEQRHNVVTVQYAGRNGVINTENTKLADNMRNLLIGVSAKIGLSFPQWKALTLGIIKKEYNVK